MESSADRNGGADAWQRVINNGIALQTYKVHEDAEGFWILPTVRAEPRAEAGADWPRRDDDHLGPERLGDACRSGSARTRG